MLKRVMLGGTPRRRPVMWVLCAFLLATLLSVGSSVGSGSATAAIAGKDRYVLSGNAPAGTPVLADYGSAVLVDLTPAEASALRAAGRSLELLPDPNVLKLKRVSLDTSAALPAVPAELRAGLNPTSWVVQLVGPPAAGWLDSLEAAGLHLAAHGYVPENGWLVTGDAAAAERVSDYAFVQAVVPYHPFYRLDPRLDGLTGAQQVRVLLFDDADLDAVAGKIAALGANELGRIADSDVKLLRLSVGAALVPALARMTAVQWIEPVVPLELHNDNAADTMGVRPVWSGVPEAPGVTLQGEGEIAAVADTGLDNGNPLTIHPDFRGRVVQLQAWGRPGPGGNILTGNASDPSFDAGGEHGVGGHGTHTAGSVLGDGTAWSTLNLTGCTGSCRPARPPKGMAPEAGLVFQSISGPDMGSLSGVPEDTGELYGAAYDQGARVHSNSYGSSAAGAYDGQAFLLDRFMETHPDMLITFSAGNSGSDLGTPDGRIDPGSIGSPATAKDTLAVGASEDNRAPGFTSGRLLGFDPDVPLYSTYAVFALGGPPFADDTMSDSEEGMVAFSSRGPTADGRIKPDVVGIGTQVLSTRSTIITTTGDDVEFHYWSLPEHGSSVGQPGLGDYPASTNTHYGFNGGTSMSNPLVAGTATVVRQYLRQVRGFTSPSAALVKAALTAGGDELQGQYGPGTPDVVGRPDHNEGWGKVDVASTIAPTGASVRYFDDPVGLRTGAVSRYRVDVTSTTAPLRAQLVWTDVAGSLVAAKSLVNDLDLTVTAPNGTVYRGNAFGDRGPAGTETPSLANPAAQNHVDNVEGIHVPTSAMQTGTWTVEVRGFSVPSAPQKFALVVRGGLGAGQAAALHTDAASYRSGGRPVQIVAVDPAANTTAGNDSITVRVSTDTAPAGVSVTLTETGAAAGVFVGQIGVGLPDSTPTSESIPGDDGDTLTVQYVDSSSATVTATALVDNTKPVITGLTEEARTPFSFDASFQSSEPAAGAIEAGGQPGTFGNTGTDPALTLDRTVTVPGLDGAKRYYYRANATDDPGNVGVEDNNGRLHTLRTRESVVEYSYDAETEAGWTHQTNPNNSAATGADQWHLTSRADAVHSGAKAWLFGPENPAQNYQDNVDAFLDSPQLTRTASAWASLRFWANYDTEKGFDGVNVLASDDGGATYRLLPLIGVGPASPPGLASAQIDGNSGGYRLLTFDLSSFTGATLRIRLQFTSDGGVVDSGFAMDDLSVTGSREAPVEASFVSSTAGAGRAGNLQTLGTLTVDPDRDWVRLTHLEFTSTGADGDGEAVVLTAEGQDPLRAPLIDDKAVFDGLTLDSSAGDPLEVTVAVELSGPTAGAVGLTLDASTATLAAPDSLRPGTIQFLGSADPLNRFVIDHDGNGKDDIAVYRPSSGYWFIANGPTFQWGGLPGDIPVPADYDGDGNDEIAIYRPGDGPSGTGWYVDGNLQGKFWGLPGDLPVPGDYNGDGTDEVAVFRPSNGTWYTLGDFPGVKWGQEGDIPVPGNFDADPADELAVYRPADNTWYIANSATGVAWGAPGDIPVAGNYAGGSELEIAVFRPSNGYWYVNGNYGGVQWGQAGDIPLAHDSDADEFDDFTIYRPSSGRWYREGDFGGIQWGLEGDIP